MQTTSQIVLALLIIGISSLELTAAETKQAPEQVYVGAYVNRVFDINLKESRFSADFYLWFRWKDDSLNPHQSFQFLNGKVDEKQEVRAKTKIDGVNYACIRVVGTVSKFWDLTSFPLDNQNMRFGIEEKQNDSSRMVYVLDKANLGINPKLRFPGWDLDRAASQAEARDEEYATNYGAPNIPSGTKIKYPQFRFNVRAVRVGYGYFLKLFTGLFVATLISFLAFFIKVTDLDPRFGLGIGSIFAAVASQYVSSSVLPDSSLLTLADKMHICAFVFIFLSLLESTISLAYFEAGREALSRRIDHVSFFILLPIYLAIHVMITFWS